MTTKYSTHPPEATAGDEPLEPVQFDFAITRRRLGPAC
jgi:hypothetical protein